jgi:flagellar M-ring protein FliF
MAFLNQSLAQMRDLFASMTPAARITAALLLGVIVVSLGYLFQGYAGASEEYLFNGEILPSREADYIEAAIAKKKLTVLPRQAGRIVVPRGQRAEYLAAVAEDGALPKDFDRLLDESLNAGMWESNETRRARLKATKEKQLSMMLSQMNGIDEAKVLYDESKPVGFQKPKVTATVSVMPQTNATLEPHQVKMIRKAVAGAISGLDPEDVAILDQSTGSELGGMAVSPAMFDDPYYQTRVNYERKLQGDIEHLLNDFIKPAPRVKVSAELDPMMTADVRSVRPDGEVATISESTESESTTSTQTEDRGQVGITAQGPNRTGAEQAVAKNEQTTQSENSDIQNFVPHSQETRREMGLTPKVVRASVAIPTEYLVRVWRERTPDAAADAKPDPTTLEQIEEQTKTNIKLIVSQLLPKGVAENAQSYVEVTFFQSLTPPPVPAPSMASEGLLWAGNNSGSLIMAGLAVVSLLMLRSIVKAIPASDGSLAFKAPALAMETVGVSSAAAPVAGQADATVKREGARPRLRLKKGPTLKDDLAELVKEDPEGAAAILRTWIGNAG